MSTFHPAASSLVNFNDTISMVFMTRLFIYISCSHLNKNQRLSWHHSRTLFGDSTVNTKSTQRGFGFFLPAKRTVMYTCYQRGFTIWGVWSIFCLSLLSAYWVLSAYFLAGLEISVIDQWIRYCNLGLYWPSNYTQLSSPWIYPHHYTLTKVFLRVISISKEHQ